LSEMYEYNCVWLTPKSMILSLWRYHFEKVTILQHYKAKGGHLGIGIFGNRFGELPNFLKQ